MGTWEAYAQLSLVMKKCLGYVASLLEDLPLQGLSAQVAHEHLSAGQYLMTFLFEHAHVLICMLEFIMNSQL